MSKAALITGASRGIGRACALRLAQEGYKIAVNYQSNHNAAQEVIREIEAQGGQAISVAADISQEDEVQKLYRTVTEQFGTVDLLINNAGVGHFGLLTDISLNEWQRIFAVNVDSAFLCTQAFLPAMISQKSGCIINISSIWGLVGASCEVAYSASKGALLTFTKALAKEVGPSGVRVNCIAPGVIDTAMNSHLSADDMAALCEETPLERIGQPKDIAECAAWLASENASFITGQVISPNGGFTIV